MKLDTISRMICFVGLIYLSQLSSFGQIRFGAGRNEVTPMEKFGIATDLWCDFGVSGIQRYTSSDHTPVGSSGGIRTNSGSAAHLTPPAATDSAATSHKSPSVRRRPWFGIVLGVPISGDFLNVPDTGHSGHRRLDMRFAAGLMADVGISQKLSLDVNGLYRRLHFPDGPEVVVTWQIPVMLKYRFSSQKVNPFVEGGPSFRLSGNLNATDPSHYGITAGAGVEMGWRRLRVAPTVRFTRWGKDGYVRISPQSLTNHNQVEFLVGISF